MVLNKKYINEFNLSQVNLKLDAELQKAKKNELLIKINGNIETHQSYAFGNAIVFTLKSCKDIQSLIFDLSKVNYLSSSGVGSFIHILTIPERENIEIYFLNINKKLKSVFMVLGFADLIQTLNDNSFKTIFPLSMLCPECEKENICSKEGNYSCIHCKCDFYVNNKGVVVS